MGTPDYSARLRAWRLRVGLSHEQLAVALRCTSRTIANREAGGWQPTITDLITLDQQWPGARPAIEHGRGVGRNAG